MGKEIYPHKSDTRVYLKKCHLPLFTPYRSICEAHVFQKNDFFKWTHTKFSSTYFLTLTELELFCENVRHLATSNIFVMRKAFRLSSCHRSGGRSYHSLRRIPGETVLKVKVPARLSATGSRPPRRATSRSRFSSPVFPSPKMSSPPVSLPNTVNSSVEVNALTIRTIIDYPPRQNN